MALYVLGLEMAEAAGLLSGRRFEEAGIHGVVESDFFDWLLDAEGGAELVDRIAAHAGRFRLHDVKVDVLKGLYESLIDPEQRHELGEYYTPDWLAAKMCDRAIEMPQQQHVLDPSCGSGTFLFHAIRRLLLDADKDGVDPSFSLQMACKYVRGVDVHPVAVQIARVTYLLGLGQERLAKRRGELSIPVYLGDSLQWNTAALMMKREVRIDVPDDKEPLHFPFGVAQDPGLFDSIINRMLALSEQNASGEAMAAWLRDSDPPVEAGDIESLVSTYEHLRALNEAERNHIWGFVARNLIRPAWLSRDDERADVIIGNPPWLSYRYMTKEMQKQFKKACQERGIWTGGTVATHQDMSAYFFARCVELYLPNTGVIAFVMPFAVMSRGQYEGFRKGQFGSATGQTLKFVRFVEAWAFEDDLQPLFPVPSCVLIGEIRTMARTGPVLPAHVSRATGKLPRRDASTEEANVALVWHDVPWPTSRRLEGTGYYEAFKQGASMVPRIAMRGEEGRDRWARCKS